MVTADDYDELLLARIGYKQVLSTPTRPSLPTKQAYLTGASPRILKMVYHLLRDFHSRGLRISACHFRSSPGGRRASNRGVVLVPGLMHGHVYW